MKMNIKWKQSKYLIVGTLVIVVVILFQNCSDFNLLSLGSEDSPEEFQPLVSAPEVVAYHDSIVQKVPHSQVDAPTSFFRIPGSSPNLKSITPFWDYTGTILHAFMEGSPEQPMQSLLSIRSGCDRTPDYFCKKKDPSVNSNPIFTDFAEHPPQDDLSKIVDLWLMDVYFPDLSNRSKMLGFIHEESENRANNTRLGLAWSNDFGNTWKYLGRIVKPHLDKPNVNMEGVPYFVKDGYFYIYFKDGREDPPGSGESHGVGLARASINEVLQAANDGSGDVGNGLWKKWRKINGDSNWNEPGLGGMPDFLGVPGITHSQIVYSTATNKAYLVTTAQSLSDSSGQPMEPTWVKLFESSDGIQWQLKAVIAEENVTTPPHIARAGYQYCSSTDSNGSPNKIVEKDFYVYCYKYNLLAFHPNQTPSDPYAGRIHHLIRWKIHLE